MPAGEHGPGARALLRPRTADMFGLGTREAVLAAVRGTDPDAFGAPASADELLAALGDCGWPATRETRGVAVGCPEPERPLVRVVAHAHGWRALPGGDVVLVPGAAG
jgi:coenzyme F420-0:L-glutamate ligase/coenzyme F420-1:gamma-L-glutamate ligase